VKTRLVLFDIDGTLLLSAGAGRRAILTALAAELAGCDRVDTVRFDGKTDPQILCELLEATGRSGEPEQAQLHELCLRYLAHLEVELQRADHRTTVMPGVRALLDRLEAEPGVVLGLLTGNLREGAVLKLRSGGIAPERFVVGAYGSDSRHRPELPPIAAERARPHFGRVPSGDEVVIIGDTPADVTCGSGIGARAVAVATGSYAAGALQEAGAYAVFEDLSDTRRALDAILW